MNHDTTSAEPDGPDRLVAHAVQRLRLTGQRITTPRRAVIKTLASMGGHPGADELWAALSAEHPGVHRATVYRTLETLADLGVVTHVHMSHGTTTFHLRGPEDADHLHARCRRCGVVQDLPADLLDAVSRRLATDRGFELDARHVALSGTCQSCRDRR